MSAICGLVKLDRAPATIADLDDVLASLSARGPDGSNAWINGSAVLGHRLLRTTPQATLGPWLHAESGCAITADVRLDNRDALLAAFAAAPPDIDDAGLILLAYLRWGRDCVVHLAGDFAFAIWDPRERRLFAARDRMGLKQFCFHHAPGRLFAFATDYQAIAGHADVPRRLNLARVADLLDQMEHLDTGETFFAGIERLPPAHTLTLEAHGLNTRRYWALEPRALLSLKSDADYADALRAEFSSAVERRLRAAGPVGLLLSGGLDSGSIAALAAPLSSAEGRAFRTYSAISDDPASRESAAIRRVTAALEVEPALITLQGVGQDELAAVGRDIADPFDSHMVLHRLLYRTAAAAGTKIVLDGMMGDVVLSAHSRVPRLVRRGRLLALVQELQGAGLGGAIREIARGLVPTAAKRWRRQRRWAAADRALGQAGLIDNGLAGAVDLRGRRRLRNRQSWGFDLYDEGERVRAIAGWKAVAARERCDRVAGQCGIETRDPFADVQFIDFCLSLPDSQLQKGGLQKAALRRAMAGRLPRSHLLNRVFDHLGSDFTAAAFAGESLASHAGALARLVRPEALTSDPIRLGRVRQQPEDLDAIGLAIWLEREALDGSNPAYWRAGVEGLSGP